MGFPKDWCYIHSSLPYTQSHRGQSYARTVFAMRTTLSYTCPFPRMNLQSFPNPACHPAAGTIHGDLSINYCNVLLSTAVFGEAPSRMQHHIWSRQAYRPSVATASSPPAASDLPDCGLKAHLVVISNTAHSVELLPTNINTLSTTVSFPQL